MFTHSPNIMQPYLIFVIAKPLTLFQIWQPPSQHGDGAPRHRPSAALGLTLRATPRFIIRLLFTVYGSVSSPCVEPVFSIRQTLTHFPFYSNICVCLLRCVSLYNSSQGRDTICDNRSPLGHRTITAQTACFRFTTVYLWIVKDLILSSYFQMESQVNIGCVVRTAPLGKTGVFIVHIWIALIESSRETLLLHSRVQTVQWNASALV